MLYCRAWCVILEEPLNLFVKIFFKAFFISVALFLLLLFGAYLILKGMGTLSQTEAESYEYYRDSFTLLSHNAAGMPIVMDMDMNRKEVNGSFIHYYSGTLWFGEEKQDFYTRFDSEDPAVQADGYLLAYATVPAQDLSTRATHEIMLSTDWGELSFSAEVEGDFLTKNTLNYTRFSSAVPTTLLLGGAELPAQVMWENAYAADYRETVFFEGRESLNSETHLFTLWTEDGDFLHIDQSIVESEQSNYQSHTWVLHKEADEMTRKCFEAEILLNETGVAIELPEWDILIQLDAPKEWASLDASGWISGTFVSKTGETQRIEGYFKNVLY